MIVYIMIFYCVLEILIKRIYAERNKKLQIDFFNVFLFIRSAIYWKNCGLKKIRTVLDKLSMRKQTQTQIMFSSEYVERSTESWWF